MRAVKLNSESGSAMVFGMLVLLPILLLLLVLTVDVDRFHTERNSIQSFADEAALYAYRYLPDQKLAAKAARTFLAQRADIAEVAEVTIDTDGITITASPKGGGWFAGGLQKLVGSSSTEPILERSVAARVRGTPLDVFVVMDRSSYLAPDLPHGSSWGDKGEWPVPEVVREKIRRYDELGEQISDRLILQQCFNPQFSAVKEATLRIIDEVGAFRLNAIGAGATPHSNGSDLGFTVIRGVHTSSETANGERVRYEKEAPTAHGLNNVHCMAIAKSGYPYSLPKMKFTAINAKNKEKVSTDAVDDLDDSSVDAQDLSLAEAVWAQVVRESARADIGAVINKIGESLLAAIYRGERGGLGARASRIGFVILGDIPRIDGARYPAIEVQEAIANSARQLDARIAEYSMAVELDMQLVFMVLKRHESEFSLSDFDALKAQLKELSTKYLTLRAFSVDREEDLSSAVRTVLFASRSGVVAR